MTFFRLVLIKASEYHYVSHAYMNGSKWSIFSSLLAVRADDLLHPLQAEVISRVSQLRNWKEV